MKILIAEDDATTALLLQRTLTKGGYDVTVARDGIDALAAIKHKPFDALITDWMMPRMDGIELIRQVRTIVKSDMIIIVITALDSVKAKAHALEAGANDYLARPYQLSRRLQKSIGELSCSQAPAT